jgi:probable rRNA maturation factor
MTIYWDETPLPDELREVVEKALLTGAMLENVDPDSEVSVTFMTAAEIRVINRDFRKADKETDVLSFPGFPGSLALGDILICLNVAERQARLYGHSFVREVAFLAVHGFLHLLGYDHALEEDEIEMRAAQYTIMEAIGVMR